MYQKYHKLHTYASALERTLETISEADKMLSHPVLKYDRFLCLSIKLLKHQTELRGFIEKSENKRYQCFALFNTIHHIFYKPLHLPLLGG